MKKLVKRRILPFLAVLAVLIGTLVLPISAEIDWLSYPTSNHFDFDGSVPADFVVTRGTGSVDYSSKSIKMVSTGHDTYAWVSGVIQLEPGADYVLHMKSTQIAQIFIFTGSSHFLAQSAAVQNPKIAFTTDSTGQIMIRLDNGVDYSTCVFSEIMLSPGETIYPYQPYIPSDVRDSYEVGFTTGLEHTSRVLNPLQSASYIRLTWTDNVSSGEKSVDYSYDELLESSWYSSGTVDVSKFLFEQGRALYPVDEDDASSVDGYDGDLQYPTSLSLHVRWPSLMDSSYTQFSLNGPAGGFVAANLYRLVQGSLEAVSPAYSENVINGNYSFNSVRRISFPASVQFEEFSLTVSGSAMLLGSYGPSQLSDMKVNFFSGGTYSQGYSAGLKEGLSVGREDALNQTYKDGHSAGYASGFNDGKVEGLSIAKTGDFRSLILAVVEAPINTFQSLFNFEILGMDMRAAFGALMTMCVVLIVVKKVVL